MKASTRYGAKIVAVISGVPMSIGNIPQIEEIVGKLWTGLMWELKTDFKGLLKGKKYEEIIIKIESSNPMRLVEDMKRAKGIIKEIKSLQVGEMKHMKIEEIKDLRTKE